MSAIEILLNEKLITALIIFTLFSFALEVVGGKILEKLEYVRTTEWLFEKIYIPLFRAIGLMIFILLSYPVLFGLTEAPRLLDLLTGGSHRISTLMNILFVLPLAFSLIPIFGNIPALLLPVQAIAGSTLIFSWMQASLGIQNIRYVPSFTTLLVIILFSIITHAFSKWVSLHVSENINQYFHVNDGQKLVYRTVVIIAQLPVILIYTTGLGKQLS